MKGAYAKSANIDLSICCCGVWIRSSGQDERFAGCCPEDRAGTDKGAELKELSKEVEHGKTFYEAETRVNGRGRDLVIDANGEVVAIEEEVTLDSLPAAARAAIEKSASGGKITKVESVTKGKTVVYEAALVKAGKKSEITVEADGSIRK